MPSVYTLIYWMIQEKKIAPEALFTFLELYWPTFIQRDKYIFLNQMFSDEKYTRSLKDNSNPEFWINLLTIDDFFAGLDDEGKQATDLAQRLVEIWKVKLEKEFPTKKFIVEYLEDTEAGDYGLTFYQADSGIPPVHPSCEG